MLACSANSTNPDCRPGVGTRPARIGVFAANFANKTVTITRAVEGQKRTVIVEWRDGDLYGKGFENNLISEVLKNNNLP